MIRDVEVGGRRIWAKVVYNLSYDLGTKEFRCDCRQYQFNGWCKHITEFKKMIEDQI